MSEPLWPQANKPDAPSSAGVRRPFQFSLRAILVLMGLLGLVLMVWGQQLASYRAQGKTMALIKRLNGSYRTLQAATWANWLTLTPPHDVLLVNLADCDKPTEYLDAVSRLPCLETLIVGGSAFGDEQLAALRKLSTLRWLVLDATSVTPGAVEELQRSLPQLYVDESQRRIAAEFHALGATVVMGPPRNVPSELLRRVGTEFLRNDIVSLDLNNTQITDAGLGRVAVLKDLRVLRLTNTPVTDAGLVHIAGLKKLMYFSLAGTKVTDAGLSHLSGLENLRVLRLQHTQVTDAGLSHLASLPKLGKVSLQGTEVTAAAREKLDGPVEEEMRLPRD